MFELAEQLRPADRDEEKVDEPSKTKRTVLLSMVTADSVFIATFSKKRATFRFRI
jgi:hypothetical protein